MSAKVVPVDNHEQTVVVLSNNQHKKNNKKEKRKKNKRPTISKAFREQIWVMRIGDTFHAKCPISWCNNQISVLNYSLGHNIPHSKGGSSELDNLIPICHWCNEHMANKYTIDEWNHLEHIIKDNWLQMGKVAKPWYVCF